MQRWVSTGWMYSTQRLCPFIAHSTVIYLCILDNNTALLHTFLADLASTHPFTQLPDSVPACWVSSSHSLSWLWCLHPEGSSSPRLLAATLQGKKGHWTLLCRASDIGSRALENPCVHNPCGHTCAGCICVAVCQWLPLYSVSCLQPHTTYQCTNVQCPLSRSEEKTDESWKVQGDGSGKYAKVIAMRQSLESSPRLSRLISLPLIK